MAQEKTGRAWVGLRAEAATGMPPLELEIPSLRALSHEIITAQHRRMVRAMDRAIMWGTEDPDEVPKLEYRYNRSCERFLSRFPGCTLADREHVQRWMPHARWAADMIEQQERLVWVLRRILVQRGVKLAARYVVHQAFKDLGLDLDLLPDAPKWMYGISQTQQDYAREHGVAAFAEKVLEDLDRE